MGGREEGGGGEGTEEEREGERGGERVSDTMIDYIPNTAGLACMT